MRGTVSDRNMPADARRALLLKKIPRNLRKWRREPEECSIAKLRKLQALIKELAVDETPWAQELRDLRNIVIVRKIMET